VGEAPKYAASRLGENLLAGGDFESDIESLLTVRAPIGQTEPTVVRDTAKAWHGAASLRIDKTNTRWVNGAGIAIATTGTMALEPGKYVVQGRVLIEKELVPAGDEGESVRVNDSMAMAHVNGGKLKFDPPAEISLNTGRFIAEEPTAGWEAFAIGFEVEGEAADVSIGFRLGGKGSVWFDDLSVRRVMGE